jgi:hypothetical protein
MTRLKLAVVEPEVGDAQLDGEWPRRELVRRIPSVPAYRQFPLRAPGELHRPVWREDPRPRCGSRGPARAR